MALLVFRNQEGCRCPPRIDNYSKGGGRKGVQYMAVPMIFGQGAGHESTSEASTSSPPQANFFGFLLHTNPLDAIWQ